MSALLDLPVELQIQLYRLALFNEGAYHITVQNSRKIFSFPLKIKDELDGPPSTGYDAVKAYLPPDKFGVLQNIGPVGHHVATSYPCGCKDAQGSKSACTKKLHLCRETDPYKRMGCACDARPTNMALLSVWHSIRKVAVPIVYEEKILDLVLREDTLPFLEDLTPFAHGSIENISLTIQLCNTHLDEQVRRANVLAYIGKHPKSLRSLVVTVYDESDTFADFDARLRRHPSLIATIKNRHESREEFEHIRLSAVNKLVERWNMRWFRALAEITGLSTFQFNLYTLVKTSNDGWNVVEGFMQGSTGYVSNFARVFGGSSLST